MRAMHRVCVAVCVLCASNSTGFGEVHRIKDDTTLAAPAFATLTSPPSSSTNVECCLRSPNTTVAARYV